MASSSQRANRNSILYPQVVQSNPDSSSSLFTSNRTQSSYQPMYPTVDSSQPMYPTVYSSQPSNTSTSSLHMQDLFPDTNTMQHPHSPTAPIESVEEVIVSIPGAILHLIDKQYSVELASGDLSIIRLRQGQSVVAVFARVADDIQWPLAKDAPSVKLDDSHYFFSLFFRSTDDDDELHRGGNVNDPEELLNYGVTIASKGQETLLHELDQILGYYSSFSVQKVANQSAALDVSVAKEISPVEMKSENNKEIMEGKSTAYWTTLAPNVEDYSSTAAKAIAAGSGQLIRGILWCGDVTVDRLKWGDEFLKKRMEPCKNDTEISPETLRRIKRVKKMSKMSQKVASGVLSGVVKVSGYFTSSVANSKMGKKIFGLLPGEVVLASLDGFGKVFDAVEVTGKNVMSTTSVVTTGLVSHRHGEKAAEATHEGLDAAGHAVGTAWAVLKIRKALNPKGLIKPTSLAKSAAKAASEAKSKHK